MMTTERLFDRDAELLDFDALVLSCDRGKDGWEAVLDRTAFFPEGGGQGADHGLLGPARVLDVHDRKGIIVHLLDAPLTAGETVHGEVDAERRLSMMQQHTGEHILSGLICRLYHCSNVGFHIGTDAVTVDFNAELGPEDLLRVERLANECVWRDQPVRTLLPDPEELRHIEYRSKKEIDGEIRIVTIDGVDTCACCGTHVPSTGRVGQIKILSCIRYKGGVRLSILCGMRALAYEQGLLEENRAVSRLLSAKQGELAPAVSRLLEERDALRWRTEALGMRLFEAACAAEQGSVRVVTADMLEPGMLRKAAGRLAAGARLALVLLPKEDGWSFALSGAEDVRPACRALCARFGGKGGGPADMAQGILAGGSEAELRRCLEEMTEDGHAQQ